MSSNSDRVDIAHRTLRQAIIEQALKAGTKLPEDEIGRHFSMSRTLVRAVLAKLQAQGLVDTYHKRTATVAQPSLAEARDAFAVRRALEREVMKAVMKRWNPTMEKTLRDHVEEEEAAHAKAMRGFPPGWLANSTSSWRKCRGMRCLSAIFRNSCPAVR